MLHLELCSTYPRFFLGVFSAQVWRDYVRCEAPRKWFPRADFAYLILHIPSGHLCDDSRTRRAIRRATGIIGQLVKPLRVRFSCSHPLVYRPPLEIILVFFGIGEAPP